jgi:uncharacterized membrane protein YphA (DoxX/SURF4 family)
MAHKQFLIRLLILSVIITYISTGIGYLISYQKAWTFFTSSGSSEWFMVFIILIEIICGLGVLFPRFRRISCLLLACERVI